MPSLASLQSGIACAALCCGYMLDGNGYDDVARAAAQFGFANPAEASAVPPDPCAHELGRAGAVPATRRGPYTARTIDGSNGE